MSYELTRHPTDTVLQLALRNTLSLQDLKQINQQVVDALDKSNQKLTLVIDASSLKASYNTVEHLRATQLYRDHPILDTIVIIASDKLNRLVTLLAFHLARVRFIQFDDAEQAQRYVQKQQASGKAAQSKN
ncbi:MAG: hypothetical protein JXQ72_03600 [Anaerolineae bacterium]|nr:hypothetical protein [Anaerolineae bacterium]